MLWPSLALVICTLPSSEAALGLGGWLLRNGATGEISTIRQPLATAPLPGERRTLQLDGIRGQQQIATVRKAVAESFGLLALELVTPGGNIAAVSPLIEVASLIDMGESVLADIRCVGRARLREKKRRDGSAVVSPFYDASLHAGSDGEGVTEAVNHAFELHAACLDLDERLSALSERTPETLLSPLAPAAARSAISARAVPTDKTPPPGARKARRPARLSAPLPELLAASRDTILSQPAAQCMWPVPSLERLPMWSAEQNGELLLPGGLVRNEAELSLLSFAACTSLRPFERLHALETTLPVHRLRHAATALQRHRNQLSAMLALSQAAQPELSAE